MSQSTPYRTQDHRSSHRLGRVSLDGRAPVARPLTRKGLLRRAAAFGLVVLGAAACNSSSSPTADGVNVGAYSVAPGGDRFFVDSNFRGLANELHIVRQYYGRLVSIASEDANGGRRVIHRDFVVDPRSESSWAIADYSLETNRVTGAQTLVIKADFSDTTGASLPPGSNDATGRSRFLRLLRSADGGRVVSDNGFSGPGTYTMVPRNAALVFVFDDLIDPLSVSDVAVKFLEGSPAIVPLSPTPRYFLDSNHGDLADADGEPGLEFYSTRLIVDAAVSELESANSVPFAPTNNRGFPASTNANLANIQVRFPSRPLPAQSLPPLQNLTEATLSSANNGTFDFSTASRDIVRAFRSGGDQSVADPFNGYLPDEVAPAVVSSQPAIITTAPQLIPGDSPLTYNLPEIAFNSPFCAPNLRPGDIIAQAPYFSRVLNSVQVDVNGVANNVEIELIEFPSVGFSGPEQYTVVGLGPVQYRAPITPDLADRPECFVTIIPTPIGGVNNPDEGVATDASFAIRFNEPIDPGPLEPYESFTLSRRSTPLIPTDYVPGTLEFDASLTLFRFRPSQPLAHVFGNDESYYLLVRGGPQAPRDLAGNLVGIVPQGNSGAGIELKIDPDEPTSRTGGHVFRFSARDEQFPFADQVNARRDRQILQEEWTGSYEPNYVRGRLRGRPVIRFQSTVAQTDDSPLVNAMIVSTTGTSLPLNPAGALTQWVWRYIDLGLDLYNQNSIQERLEAGTLDIDVEGLYLSPRDANPVFETYPEFEIAMTHSNRIPDEAVTPTNALIDPGSGMVTTLLDNLLDQAEAPFKVVHPRQRGYISQPGNATQASNGTFLISLGLNDDLPASQHLTFTYRDTGIDARGGSNGAGLPTLRFEQITGAGPYLPFVPPMMPPDCTLMGPRNPIYPAGDVRTAGLPLMIQVKCYPTTGESTQNVYAHAIAHGPSLQPAFRAFSAGGRDQSGTLRQVDPDSVTVAQGGFDPTTTPTGQPSSPIDNTVYFGAIDFVTRISRAHSVFVPAYDPTGGLDVTLQDIANDPRFNVPVFEPPTVYPAQQPVGTSLEFEYRGARAIASAGDNANVLAASTNAFFMDPYGDFYGTLPLDLDITQFDGITYDPALGNAGNGSCFDGSFSYPSISEHTSPTELITASIDFQSDDTWRSDISAYNGASWIQTRITFISNIASGRVPEISALGLNFREQ